MFMDRNQEAQKIREEIGDLKRKLHDMYKDEEGTISSKAREYMQMMADRKKWAMEKAKYGLKKTDEWAHENPWKIVAGALLMGLLTGLLISRKRH